ncbi:ergothioneine biosynthesis glutamate--cysteine ligase EgtA [Embleya sp. NPDC050493]|uniref:ergothioneine biosynthesis glutamate--cysteine ligase EgtA n=1 Tax=Embleya sp. NPDC050493 TaxID=3363989 RepID=UPI0037B0AAA5
MLHTTVPPAHAPVDVAACLRHARSACLRSGPPRLVGVELEWLVQDVRDPALPVDEARLAGVLEACAPGLRLPLGTAVSREPGGQVELGSQPADSLTACVRNVREDLRTVRAALASVGYRTAGYGVDPWREPARTLVHLPRYTAMERLFDRCHPWGRFMMGASASVQVCVDAGTEDPGPFGRRRRWRLAHLLGPVLVAAFANSPMFEGRPTGWRSTRQAIWARLDPGRTLAPLPGPGTDLRDAWARYALDASVMCVRAHDEDPWVMPVDLTFRRWIEDAGRNTVGRPPTLEDFEYHLGTLFPPVRPQGYLELRMIDAQPGDDGWLVPLAVVAALFEDPVAGRAAERALALLDAPPGPPPRNGLWRRAARRGMADRPLRHAAQSCLTAASAALGRRGSPELQDLVDEFTDRYVARGRCPADDLLDASEPARARHTPRPEGAPTWPA